MGKQTGAKDTTTTTSPSTAAILKTLFSPLISATPASLMSKYFPAGANWFINLTTDNFAGAGKAFQVATYI